VHAPQLVSFLLVSSIKLSVQLQCCVSCRRNFRRMASVIIFFLWRCGSTRAMAFSFVRFQNYTQRRTTFGRTPLVEWSARRRDLYLTQHLQGTDIHALVGFEPTISAGERQQTYALDRAATGIGYQLLILNESVNRITCCNLIVALSCQGTPHLFWKQGCNKIPTGTYSEPGGSSIHPSILLF